MPQWVFPDFLDNPESYSAARTFWRELWGRVQQRATTGDEWELDWMNNPDSDGNPIFTAICRSQGRGVRIIQEEPGDSEEVNPDFWTDSIHVDDSEIATQELVIACSLSVENQSEVELLLCRWVETGQLAETSGLDSGPH